MPQPQSRETTVLLITDDRRDAALALFSEAHVLGTSRRPFEPPRRFSRIVVHVALEQPATVDALQAALAACREGTGGTLIFALRDDHPLSYALANGFGATRIVAADRGGSDWTRRLCLDIASPVSGSVRERGQVAAPHRAIDAIVEEAATAAAVLSDLFAAATRRAPVAMADVERGAAAVLRGVRDDLLNWIEVVRRYDDSTYQHCLLVAGFCAALSERVGFSCPRQHLVVQAALLHDIGKARVPLALLNKPDALTSAEAAVVRRHPSDGYYMLAAQSDIPALIRDVALHHHELLDGSGYPHRLRGTQISEDVRLSTVCDIYAALVERRPYRQPMAPMAAFEVLVAMGSKLDAMFVGALSRMLEAPSAPALAGAS